MANKKKKNHPNRQKFVKKSPKKRGFLGWITLFTSLTVIWLSALVILVVAYQATQLPDISKLEYKGRNFGVRLLNSEGAEFASFGDLYMKPVEFSEIPTVLINALLATEDRRFFSHFGVDPMSIARAMFVNLKEGKVKQGGSTLTQQLAKNLFLRFDRSLERKVQELLLSFWLEMSFSKKQLLTIYLNRVYFGSGAYGIRAATYNYFGKPIDRLKLFETALLVGLLKAPSRYNPIVNEDLSRQRTHQILKNMVSAGMLSNKEREIALNEPLKIKKRGKDKSGKGYFADWIRSRASAYATNIPEDRKVFTTLKPRLQQIAEMVVAEGLRRGEQKKALQSAMVVLDNSGAVLAMVGGKNYSHSQFNRATQALRQPGSAFKPFVYLAALTSGFKPETKITDTALKIGRWSPKNFDGKFRGVVSLKHAISMSLNAATVRLSEKIGRVATIRIANQLGILSQLKNRPSLALGTSEISLLQITAAYAALSNGGYPVEPFGVAKVTSPNGNMIYERRTQLTGPITSPDIIASMDDMLEEVIRTGTGKKAHIDRRAAGKTGTSQDYRDAWFIGYSSGLTAGVWIGRDDNLPMEGITGGGLPAEVWGQFMIRALH